MTLSLEEQLKQGLIAPGVPFPIRQTVELSFQQDTLDKLQESSKQFKLTESAGGTAQRKLFVTVEGIHTGMTKNKTFYPGDTLSESVPTWTTPHHKPVLKNHNEYSEPLGRIVSGEYVESTLTDKYTVRLKLEVTDQDAIDKVLDGRYLTLSVGGSANRVLCSACAKDLVKEGYCGHRRGQTYEGKEAYWTIAQYTGDEISFVNMPADVHAQVIAAELVTGEGGKNVAKDTKTKENAQTNEDGSPIKTTEASGATDPGSMIDNLLNNSNDTSDNEDPKEPETNEDPTTQNNSTDGDDNPENNGDDNAPGKTQEETDAEKLTRLEEELSTANATITTLEATIEAKDVEVTTLTASLTESKDELASKTKHLESAEAEKATLVNQNVTLARFARKSMAERVADLRIMQGKDKFEEREALIAEWNQSSSKVLESQITDLLESGKRHIETVHSPGLAVPENNAPLVDEEGNEIASVVKEASDKTELPTMKTFEKNINKSMFRTIQ